MGLISYRSAMLSVRAELSEAHDRFWQALGAPGTWWTGAERVAIAAETRHARTCALCRERKQAVSPNAVSGEHDRLGMLPSPAIDAIHRIVTDPGRLTKAWLDRTLDAGLEIEAYVEIVGLVSAVVSIDAFCRGIGVAPHPLPEPAAGEPSRYRPSTVVDGEAWVPMIPLRGATGPESDLWGSGFAPNVLRAMSVVPDQVRNMKDLATAHYLPTGNVADPSAPGYSLSRPQMELVAARVSALNQCFY